MQKKIFFLIFIFFCVIYKAKVFASESSGFNEYTERILLLRTRAGDNLFDALLAHEMDRTLYISANDFFETLGFETRLVIDAKEFKATVATPDLSLIVNWKDCQYTRNDNTKKIDCEHIKLYEEELFFARTFVEDILKAELTYLPYKSELRIFTKERYPLLTKLERAKKKAQKPNQIEFDPGFPRKESRSQTLKNHYLDQQVSLLVENQKENVTGYYSNFVTDILSHEVQLTTQGTNKTNEFTTGLIRKDYYGSKKNNYISTYQLGTVVIPTAEIIGGPTGGTGAYVTNRSQQQLISFGQREIEGNIRPEWEVELYVNDILFGRQSANNQGRYRFTNVPILYGNNNFRLEFYGPQGERNTEYLNSNITQQNIKKNQARYEVGLTQDFSRTEGHAQFTYGILDNLSYYTAYSRYNLGTEVETRDYSVLGVNSLWDNFSTSLFYGKDFTNDGDFYALRSQVQLTPTNIQFLFVDANQFRSSTFAPIGEFIDKTIQSDINLSLFGFTSMLFRLSHNLYEDKSTTNTAYQFMVFSLNSLSFQLKNDLIHGQDNEVQLIYTYLRNQFRLRSTYAMEAVETAGLEYRNRFFRDSSVFASFDRNYALGSNLIKAGYQQRFGRFTIGLEGTSDGEKAHQAFLRIRTSFGYNSDDNNAFRMSSDPLASKGNICAKVFVDKNNNGLFDTIEDQPLEKVEIKWIQGNRKFYSDESGDVFLSDLPLYQPTDIQLMHSSIQDPTLVFLDKGFRVFLQKGQCLKLSFPLVSVNDIEGQIIKNGHSRPPRTTLEFVKLKDNSVEKTRSDREGYFLFTSLIPVRYVLKVKDDSHKYTPQYYQIDTNDQDTLDQDFIFTFSN